MHYKSEKELEVARRLALEAGRKIMKFYRRSEVEKMKQSGNFRSPLTKADLAANKIIAEGLRGEFPNYGLLTEEGKDNKTRLDKKLVWVVDPLDGTKEFLVGINEFTVNIALVENSTPVLGVIFVPHPPKIFWAIKGRGSFSEINGTIKKLGVSEVKSLEDVVIVKSRFHPSDKLIKFIKKTSFREAVEIGSSLKGCSIAEGKADAYLRFDPINEWDVCAMNIIVEEAGGTMTDLKGRGILFNQKNTLIKDGFLVSNGIIHNKILEKIREFQ